jgi:prolyl-tRNA editing enzyme YbaK/EbsC (Cys-tRNA(Pro) deacylase)
LPHHQCKTLCLENTRAREPAGPFAPDHLASLPAPARAALARYFLVVTQYTARLDVESLNKALRAAAGGAAPGKAFNLRLAPEEESAALTGYAHNAVTPVGVGGVVAGAVPLILASAILSLAPPLLWMGGGEADLKLGVGVGEFVGAYRAIVMDVTVPGGE